VTPIPLVVPGGFVVDAERALLHAAAVAMTSSTGCDYLEAVRQLSEPFCAPPGFDVDEGRLVILKGALRLSACMDGGFDAALRLIEQTREPGIMRIADPDAEVRAPKRSDGGRVTVHLFAAAAMTDAGFSGLAYSGGVVSHNQELMAIDLDAISLPAGSRVPLLMNHDANRIAGRARVDVSAGAIYLRDGQFSKATAAGREAAGLFEEGQPLKLSVGVTGQKEYFPRPTQMMLNGREQTLQAVMRKPRLLEVSIVPAGADPDAGIR
jgi:hypothetical protein